MSALLGTQIFAPLARLLGLYSIKEELEELAFKYSNPEAHKQMCKRMAALAKDQANTIQSVSTLQSAASQTLCKLCDASNFAVFTLVCCTVTVSEHMDYAVCPSDMQSLAEA